MLISHKLYLNNIIGHSVGKLLDNIYELKKGFPKINDLLIQISNTNYRQIKICKTNQRIRIHLTEIGKVKT